jgi:acetyl/propionyl-CoA carboxylase alpha subunit
VLMLILNSIESMKMETVIRSPQKGVVAKLVHKEGVSFLLTQLPCNFADAV